MHPILPLPRRRQLLGLGAVAGLASFSGLAGIRIARAQTRAQSRLVFVLLRGAVDGLSLVVPHGEQAYQDARSTIAIARPGEPDGVLPLTALFGLHPALAAMLPYWESKQLAFVHASGSPDPTRSHFDAQDYMESATPGRKSTPDGWLNRLAVVLAGPGATPEAQRLLALNLGPTMPRIFAGDAAVASLAAGNAAITPGVLDRPQVAAAFSQLYAGDDRLSQTVREAAATRREIMDKLVSDDPAADRDALSLAGLARDTGRLGQLMARDARIHLAFVPVGGWDTHANQGGAKGQLANRFKLLAEALDALAKGLGEQLRRTHIVVMSEFGRTLRQNGTGGTDHGHGNVAWVLGGGVRGGQVFGAWPGLDAGALHEGRDLAITTDFRDVLADLLERGFKLGDRQLEAVLPGMTLRRPVGLMA